MKSKCLKGDFLSFGLLSFLEINEPFCSCAIQKENFSSSLRIYDNFAFMLWRECFEFLKRFIEKGKVQKKFVKPEKN